MISVKVLPADYDRIDRDVSPPIGYAVLDMIKKSMERGKNPPAEAQLFGDEHEHIALLVRIEDGDGGLVGFMRWALEPVTGSVVVACLDGELTLKRLVRDLERVVGW